MAVTIDVYGSSVSRNLFYYTGIGKYELRRVIEKNPITSLYENPVHLKKENIEDSGFDETEKTMLKIQTERIAPGLLKKDKSEYLIIDLADELLERREVTLRKSSSKDYPGVTYIAQYPGKQEEYERIFEKEEDYILGGLFPPSEMDLPIAGKKIRKFAREITCSEKNPEGYEPEKIVIIEALYTEKYWGKDGILYSFESDSVKANNRFLKSLYEILYKNFPQSPVIRFPEFSCSSMFHRDGLGPLSYSSGIYLYFERCLDTIVNYSRANTLENLWMEENLENRKETRISTANVIYSMKTQIDWLQKEVKALEEKIKKLENR